MGILTFVISLVNTLIIYRAIGSRPCSRRCPLSGSQTDDLTLIEDGMLTRTITEQNHHPDFSLDTGKRTIAVSVTTHSEGAVTRSDILFARPLNEWQPES